MTNPLTTAKITGVSTKGLYGRRKSGSRNRKTITPITVRKKKEYSPKPLNVRRARKFPKRMYNVERIVERTRALRGASDLNAFGELDEWGFGSALPRNCPTKAKK